MTALQTLAPHARDLGGGFNVRRLLPQADMPEMECFLVYPEEMKNVARVQAFRDFLVSKAQRWRY